MPKRRKIKRAKQALLVAPKKDRKAAAKRAWATRRANMGHIQSPGEPETAKWPFHKPEAPVGEVNPTPAATPDPRYTKRTFARRVVIESPYKGNIEFNKLYARACLRDCLDRGEAPIASHLLYTQPGVLDDNSPEERSWGIEAGLMWGTLAHVTVVYTDLGTTEGMAHGISAAVRQGRAVEYRTIPGWVKNQIASS